MGRDTAVTATDLQVVVVMNTVDFFVFSVFSLTWTAAGEFIDNLGKVSQAHSRHEPMQD
jgi:hypothetical protein